MHSILGRRFENRALPWDRSALPIGDVVSAVDAFEAAGLDFSVHKSPLKVTSFGRDLPVPDRYCLVRPATSFDPEPATLGLVSGSYTVLQNMDLARALDASGLLGRFRLDRVGMVNAGQKLFLSLDLGSEEVNHDPVHSYALVVTGHDGLTATSISFTPVRIECTNAMLLGVRKASVSLPMVHDRNIHREMTLRIGQFGILDQTRKRMTAALGLLALAHPSPTQISRVMEATFPLPTLPKQLARDTAPILEDEEKSLQTFNNAQARALELRKTALMLYDRLNNSGHPGNQGTAWNLYQAIIELCNHREGHQRKGGPDTIAISTLFGARALEMGRAWDAIEHLVDTKDKNR